MKLIGKGLFSKVYQIDSNTVFIKTTDSVKECLSYVGGNDYFPVIERTDEQGEYTCKYYYKVLSLKNSLDPDQYKLYQELRKLDTHTTNMYDGYAKCYDAFETISDENLKECLHEVLAELSGYGSDIRFEISPRNVAVNNGKLVLLDVFFLQSEANAVRSKKHNYV